MRHGGTQYEHGVLCAGCPKCDGCLARFEDRHIADIDVARAAFDAQEEGKGGKTPWQG
jgi:uncharacterized cysteine cluster protein YcgN (CxxCxxCC family)